MKIAVLDHGYVELVECWGTGKDGRDNTIGLDHCGEHFIDYDEDFEVGIIEAARQSTQGSFRGWEQDAKLLKFLAEHDHSTPFEFSGMVIEVQAPIMVLREWHRHRTQSYNEASARYAPLPDLYYLPDAKILEERCMAAANSSNKQSGAVGQLKGGWTAEQLSAHFLRFLESRYQECEDLYQWALDNGIPKELARLVMPVGHYSKMRASANLRNWLGFLALRCDSNAQWEIRQFANAVAQLIAAKFPRTYQLWSAANGYDGRPAT